MEEGLVLGMLELIYPEVRGAETFIVELERLEPLVRDMLEGAGAELVGLLLEVEEGVLQELALPQGLVDQVMEELG